MLIKLDENFPNEAARLLREHGHDALNVFDQGMAGFKDIDVAQVCREEGRVIFTQDMDFTNVFRFPPAECPGIVVFRVRQSLPVLLRVLREMLPQLTPESLSGSLLIVTESRLRMVRGDNDAPSN